MFVAIFSGAWCQSSACGKDRGQEIIPNFPSHNFRLEGRSHAFFPVGRSYLRVAKLTSMRHFYNESELFWTHHQSRDHILDVVMPFSMWCFHPRQYYFDSNYLLNYPYKLANKLDYIILPHPSSHSAWSQQFNRVYKSIWTSGAEWWVGEVAGSSLNMIERKWVGCRSQKCIMPP